jgi:HAD superfamily hydrolase (TIGR01509 family)
VTPFLKTHTPAPTCSAVIFDMDGLMFDTERLARTAWGLALGEWGHVLPEVVFLEMVGRTQPAVREILLKAFGRDLPFDSIVARTRFHLNDAFTREGVPFKPGLGELLEALKHRAVPVAVASSTCREAVLDRLSRAGLDFGVVVGGDEVNMGKPAPDLFLEACRRLALPPRECIVLEDSEPGIRGAHAAGTIPIMVPDVAPPGDEVRAMAHRVFPSLHEVKAVLGL